MKYHNYPDILNINWLLFGSNSKEKNDNEFNCLIPTFTKCDRNLSNHYKVIINVNKFPAAHPYLPYLLFR